MNKTYSILFISTILSLFAGVQKPPESYLGKEVKQELIQYLKSHWQSPEDYIISKFTDYDIIFLGEAHKIKHDVKLVHNLIPRLYEIGVYNLGIEFGCYEYQDKVDSLVTANSYDEALARWLMFKWGSYWGYKEYLDIYKKVWELNKSLPKTAPKFRVVNLDYRARWNLVKEGMTVEQYNKVFFKGDRDEHMAEVIQKEFIKKNIKALIYSGQYHAFTRYFEPIYDQRKKKLIGLNNNRMGNIVYKRNPDRVFNIVLHYPWPTLESIKEFRLPVNGIIDSIMKGFENKRIGFDVKDTVFGKIRDSSTFYSVGYSNFTLGEFCDGYIFQKHIIDYEGVTLDPLFITKDNFKEAVDFLPNPRLKTKLKHPKQFLSYLKSQADLNRLFGDLR